MSSTAPLVSIHTLPRAQNIRESAPCERSRRCAVYDTARSPQGAVRVSTCGAAMHATSATGARVGGGGTSWRTAGFRGIGGRRHSSATAGPVMLATAEGMLATASSECAIGYHGRFRREVDVLMRSPAATVSPLSCMAARATGRLWVASRSTALLPYAQAAGLAGGHQAELRCCWEVVAAG